MELMFRMFALVAISIASGCGPSSTTTSDIATIDAVDGATNEPDGIELKQTPANNAIDPAPPQPESAPQTAEPEPNATPGLAVGKAAPNFTLKDQAGKEQSLESMLQKGPVAMVFYRSADW